MTNFPPGYHEPPEPERGPRDLLLTIAPVYLRVRVDDAELDADALDLMQDAHAALKLFTTDLTRSLGAVGLQAALDLTEAEIIGIDDDQ